MTNAPADLLGLRSRIQAATGLSAVSVGIVGDAAHAATGGYHEGKNDLVAAGVWMTDYSVRLTRDRNGATNSASAMDIGYQWPKGGNAAWLRFNNWLAANLRSGRNDLLAIRAINYSPNGSTKWRIDRENGWATQSSTDSVDVHTHIEWYRDTESSSLRQASIDRLVTLVNDAITNTNPDAQPVQEDNMPWLHGPIPPAVENTDGTYSFGQNQTVIVPSAWSTSTITFGADFGKAKLRVAQHVVNVGWDIQEFVVDSNDNNHHDLAPLANCDRRSITREPIDADDKMQTPVGYLLWW